MAKVRSWAGLDVHAAKVVAVTVDGESGELRAQRLSGQHGEVVAFCAGLPGPARVAYEAGPTGFGLARALQAAGIGCVVAAPGKIERPAAGPCQDRPSRRRAAGAAVDGRRPARGQGPGQRGGGAARPGQSTRGRARRSDARAPPAGQAAAAPRRPLRRRRQRVDHTPPRLAGPGRPRRPGAQVTLLDYLGAIDALVIRRDALEATIAELVPGSPWAQTVARLALPARHRHAHRGRAVR